MAKPSFVELPGGVRMDVLYEDRAVIAFDKPGGWMLAPEDWTRTGRNLQNVLAAMVQAREFWARSRNLRFIRYIHRLDAETTGVILFGKSPGAVSAFGALFEGRNVEKVYIAVVDGLPKTPEWKCELPLAPDENVEGRMKTDARGKPAETWFRVLESREGVSALEARPYTGRTHQIRVHLAAAGHPVVNDPLYGRNVPGARGERAARLGLRAVGLSYSDPFTRRKVRIRAPAERFLAAFGFGKT